MEIKNDENNEEENISDDERCCNFVEGVIECNLSNRKYKDSHGRIWEEIEEGKILCINPNRTTTNTEQLYDKSEYDKIGETFEEINE
jgi:hypothetical protein